MNNKVLKKLLKFLSNKWIILFLWLTIIFNIYVIFLADFCTILLKIEFRAILYILFVVLVLHNLKHSFPFLKGKIWLIFLLHFWVLQLYLYNNYNIWIEIQYNYDRTLLSLTDKNFLYLFYNPIFPIWSISILQFIIVILFSFFLYKFFLLCKRKLRKKDLYLLVLFLGLWILYNLFLSPQMIWDNNYSQLSYSVNHYNSFLGSMSNINPQSYWIAFHEFINIFKRLFFVQWWNLNHTFILNTVLNIFNIFVIYFLSFSLWRSKKTSFWTSLFYITSIPILTYFNWEHSYVMATTMLMFFVYFLHKFYVSGYKRLDYYTLMVLSLIFLFFTHHQFILLPFFVIIYFLLFFNKKVLRIFSNYKYLVFNIFTLFLLIPVILLKIDTSYLWNSSEKYNIFWIIKTFFSLDTFTILIFTKINGFLAIDHNNIFILVLLFIWFIFFYFNKKYFKILIMLLLLRYIVVFPHYFTFPVYEVDSWININLIVNYSNAFLTDYYIKWSNTYFIFILLLWLTPVYIGKYINYKKYSKLFFIILFLCLLVIPIYDKAKISFFFNNQQNYIFMNEVYKYLEDKEIDYNLYWETKRMYWYSISWEIYKNPLESNFDIIEFEKENNYYYLWTYCYEYHVFNKPKSCYIFDNIQNVSFKPILEKKLPCNPSNIERSCHKKEMTLWLYKLEKKKWFQ